MIYLLLTLLTLAHPGGDSAYLQSLLDQKDYFRLKTALDQEGPGLGMEQRAYFQAFVDNVFARNDWSQKGVHALLETGTTLTKKQRSDLWHLQEDNYYKMGRYKDALA